MATNDLPSTTTATPSSYHMTPTPPSGTEYLHLRRASGLSQPPITPQQAEAAIQNSLYCLVARSTETEEAIGMLRLLGDGHVFLTIYDMCVLPEWGGRGIAGEMFDAAMEWIEGNAPVAHVGLFADPPGRGMYGKKGFVEPEGSVGMVRVGARWMRG